jgi:hypothetical protein
VLLHRLWVTAEAYDPLREAHRRQEEEAACTEAMAQTSEQEVKTPLRWPGGPKVADDHGPPRLNALRI